MLLASNVVLRTGAYAAWRLAVFYVFFIAEHSVIPCANAARKAQLIIAASILSASRCHHWDSIRTIVHDTTYDFHRFFYR